MFIRGFFLVFIVLLFFYIGGLIDYWQSAKHHKKPLPSWLSDYFAIFWLFLHNFILPGLMVYVVSDNLKFFLLFVGASAIGAVIWDITYSILDKQKIISTQIDYFYFRDKDYALSASQVLCWHIIRIFIGLGLFGFVTILI